MPERVEMALIISGISFVVFSCIGVYCDYEKHKSFHLVEWRMIFISVGIFSICLFGYGMLDSSYSMEPKAKSVKTTSIPSYSKNQSISTSIFKKTPSPQMKQSISKFVDKIVGPTSTPTPTPIPEKRGMIKPTYEEYNYYTRIGPLAFDSQGFYVLNASSMKYHRPSCEYAMKISYDNIYFWYGAKGNLGIKGYRRCEVCNP